MDTTDAVIEAEVGLDGEALREEERRHKEHRGQRGAEIAKPGVSIATSAQHVEEGPADETTLLLPRGDDNERRPTWSEVDEFALLPWYRRPSIWWVLIPFSIMACAFGGMLTPKINLIVELVCREYMSERVILDPGFTMIPIDFNNGNNDQCRIPEVQSRVSIINLWASLLAGGMAAITSPKLGALSDRYGRKSILVITSIGTICGEAITICAATYPESFPVNLLLLGYAVDGMTGSFIVAMAIANAYATDCTPPSKRNVVFGYFHSCLFTGVAVGPILAGYIVKVTGKIVVVFWFMIAAHLCFVFFIILCVPESLTKKRQMLAREKHAAAAQRASPASDWISSLRALNPFEPLSILWPTGPGSSLPLRTNLVFLAAIDTITFGVAMGSLTVVITYTNYMFGWGAFESGRFLTIVNSSRVCCLLILLPLLTRLVRGRPRENATRKNTGSDTFDLCVIAGAVLFDTLGYLGYALARSGPIMILSGAVAAVGGIASPTLQSSMTKHVPAERTGQLLGAISLLHAMARVLAPTVFNAIYAETVKTFPQTVFVCLAATFGLAFIISWFLKANVYFDEDGATEGEDDPNLVPHDEQGDRSRLPIAGSILALFGAALGRLRGHS